MRRSLIFAVPWFLAFSSPVLASSPSLGIVQPRGGQRGTEMEIHLHGGRIGDAQEIIWYDSNITATKLDTVDDNHVTAMITIPADCRIGEHCLRLRTQTGVSELRTFFVGPLPSVAETEPNSEFESPQPIGLNTTIAGVVESEDVDYFIVDATKGTRITAEVEAVRLGATLFDPYVAILDAKRFELASSDDSSLLLQDSVASIVAPEDGKYIVQIRESSYGGNGNCQYRLHVGTFPRPLMAYPAGGRLGEILTVTFLGDPAGPIASSITLPSTPKEKFAVFAEQNGQVSPSPNYLRVSDFPGILETEPNNSIAEATPAEGAPVALNGIIEQEGDADFFKIPLKQGQVFDIQVYARRIRSPLDPVLYLYGPEGNSIAGNDDSAGPDSYLRFQVPADGEYTIGVVDHLGKGGPEYVYRVELQPVAPSLTLTIPPVARASQDRWAMAVPRGNRFATLMLANRANFGGELVFSAANLPPGVSMACENMPDNLTIVPIVFEAAPDAAIGSTLADLSARHVDPNANITGGYRQQVDLVIAEPNQTVYYSTTIDKLAVAVTEEAPFRIDIVPPKVPLVQNGTMNLKVVATRAEGFSKPITVYFPFNPPGVGSAVSVTIPEGQNEVFYPLNANGDAPIRTWKVVVTGHADVGNGPIWVSSQLADLSIAAPYANLTLEMAAAEQGKPTEVVAKIHHNAPFDGPAKVQLVGLPAGVASTELEFTKETAELVFPVTIDASSPPGQHKTLFCQFTIQSEGEPIVHSTAFGGVLRIDPPPPPMANPAPTPAQPAASPDQPPKRLTRLEQLRLEQAERQKRLAEEAPMDPASSSN